MSKEMSKRSYEKAVAGIQELKVLQAFLGGYEAKYHVRKVAELLKMSHSTVAIALERLSDKNILGYEIAGRNKNYFLNLDNPGTKDYLINSENMRAARIGEKYFIIKKMVSELHLKQHDIIKNYPVILFGSYAKELADEGSDLDMLLIGKESKTITDWFSEFAERHNKEAHIHYFTYDAFLESLKEKDHLAKEILQNHVILNNPFIFVDILLRHFSL